MKQICLAVAVVGLATGTAQAQAQAVPASAPYSLPWLLRPAAAKNVVRSDTSIGFFDAGSAVSSTILGGVTLVPDVGVYVKGAINAISPDTGESATALSNPALIGLYTPAISSDLRLSVAFATAFPFGQGGGNTPDASRAAILSGISTRSGMENALFVPNYLTPFAGIGLAYITDAVTVQAEVTLLQLLRVKGEDQDADSSRTNFTSGLHVGRALLRNLVVSAELHYQRWLSTPVFVELDENRREQATVLGGVRVPFKLDSLSLSPGISYSRALDKPMSGDGWQIVQLDVPVVF